MKAIIIDDEKHVREGLLLLGEWEKHGIDEIFEATDGDEAIQIICEHQPEIVFTDMSMPKRDGISLLKWIHSSKLTCKTIVVSGYDDFNYMRNAIAFGSFDYILKPIQPNVLNETLARAVKEWKEQENHHLTNLEKSRVIHEAKPLLWDYLLSNALDKPKLSTRTTGEIKKEFRVDVSFKPYTVAVLPINTMIHKRYRGDIDLAFFSLLNISNEILSERNIGIAFRNLNKDEELVFILWSEDNVIGTLNHIASYIHQVTKIKCTVALGNTTYQLVESYETACKTLLNQNLLDSAWNMKVLTNSDVHAKPVIHLFDYSEEIKWAIQSGSTDQINGILDRIYHTFAKAKHISLEQIEVWENQFDILKNHWLKEYEIDSKVTLYVGRDYWNDDGVFSLSKFEEEKRKEFHDLISTVFNVQFKKEKKGVQMIEEYIRTNYHKDIKLQDIADQFFLSREYICRKFKQEYQETLTDYLTKIRIEKAKELLENPYLKIYEIADAVGYQNDKYFIKVFKKLEGKTPKEFRTLVNKKKVK